MASLEFALRRCSLLPPPNRRVNFPACLLICPRSSANLLPRRCTDVDGNISPLLSQSLRNGTPCAMEFFPGAVSRPPMAAPTPDFSSKRAIYPVRFKEHSGLERLVYWTEAEQKNRCVTITNSLIGIKPSSIIAGTNASAKALKCERKELVWKTAITVRSSSNVGARFLTRDHPRPCCWTHSGSVVVVPWHCR